MKRFKKIEFADQEIVNSFVEQIEEIVSLYDLDVEECFITDESMISDFDGLVFNKSKLKAFKDKYGFTPDNKQYLYEVSQKMKCKGKQ